jgi:antitoxin ParD1/3/4
VDKSRIERWLREEVIAGHEEYMADPSKGVSAEAIIARIKARRAAGRSRQGVSFFKDET